LTSAFLFSSKKYLTDWSRNRLNKIEKNNELLAFEVSLLPFKFVNSLFDFIWIALKSKWKHLIVLIFTIVLFHLFSSFYQSLFDFSLISLSMLTKITNLTNYYVDNSWKLTFTLVVVYFIAIALYWKEEYAFLFQLLSLPVWLSLLFLSSSIMGSYRPLFTIAFLALTCLGIYSFVHEYWSEFWAKNKRKIFHNSEDLTDDETNDQMVSSFTSSTFKDDTSSNTLIENSNETQSQTVENLTAKKEANTSTEKSPFLKNFFNKLFHFCIFYSSAFLRKITNSTSTDDNEDKTNFFNSSKINNKKSKRQRENSDKYFILLFWLFVCVKLRFQLYIAVPILVIIWKLFKNILSLVYKFLFENSSFKQYFNVVKNWFECRKEALAPKPFMLLFKFFSKGDHKVNQLLQKSLDSLISALMIIGLLLFVNFFILSLCEN
jgi:hypothetical protein